MKVNVISAIVIFVLFLFTGCSSRSDTEVVSIKFHTASENGICYCFNNRVITTKSGELVFQNKSNLPIHLYIYNRSEDFKLEYEADLDLGGMLSYANMCIGDEYTIGIRTFDGKGRQRVEVLIYNDFDDVPY